MGWIGSSTASRLLSLLAFGALLCSVVATVIQNGCAFSQARDLSSEEHRKRLLENWTARQDRIESISVEWREGRVDARHLVAQRPPAEGSFPPEDTLYEGRSQFCLSGEKSYYQYHGTGLRQFADGFRYAHRFSVGSWDGVEARSFSKTIEEGEIGVGVINTEKENPEDDTTAYQALRWFCRPLSPGSGGVGLNRFGDESKVQRWRDRDYLVLTSNLGGGGIESLWIDPERDYLIGRRTVSDVSGFTTSELTIDYRNDPAHGWVPQEWSLAIFRREAASPKIEIKATVMRLALNPAIDPSIFKFEFPKQSLVHDLRNRKRYLLTDDGGKLTVLSKHSGRSYAEILNSIKTMPTP